jgi:hypothetical protein
MAAMTRPDWRRLASEPLLHFLVLGGLLFLLWGEGGAADPSRRRIVVGPGQLDHILAAFHATWQRAPTPQELDSLIADHVREEILYREAVALGLDGDDTVVRRRMRQKMELMITSLADAGEPTQEQLASWLRDHAERYRAETRVSLRQILFSRQKREDRAEADAAAALARLRAGASGATAGDAGDATMLPEWMREAPLSEVGGQFGSLFAETVASLPLHEWSGPIETGYGVHLVLLEERIEGEIPPLDAVRDAVRRDWMAARTESVKEDAYRKLLETYDVSVELPAATAAAP